ncbi:NAD(P)H-dependent oxidoreductase [Paenibacillus methanolicus]|uniref:NAD(P)H dehydrogenase (Quinone) n=1 Tax=Paenibacillus methanolicus TaxID=582686 RepID=A0A5S5CH05_9BACL|nr:NAD(P)H-dependent oxidoreductase [Paenibacillus methanolicus]TYP79066.1 NAD(P)H dehydrogenase (quinone) [Paenibacillus methanolicus]
MNALIIFAHPHEDSFNRAILNSAADALRADGHDVTIRDLYKMNFNPVLTGEDTSAMRAGRTPEDIRTEQEYLAKADVIAFIYPIWWTGLPAILKGYVDRTFSYGFAYQYNSEGGIDKLFAGKRGVIVNTYGTPEEVYESTGMTDSLKQTSGSGIFGFCGVEVAEHLLFGGVSSVSDDVRKEMLARVDRAFHSL